MSTDAKHPRGFKFGSGCCCCKDLYFAGSPTQRVRLIDNKLKVIKSLLPVASGREYHSTHWAIDYDQKRVFVFARPRPLAGVVTAIISCNEDLEEWSLIKTINGPTEYAGAAQPLAYSSVNDKLYYATTNAGGANDTATLWSMNVDGSGEASLVSHSGGVAQIAIQSIAVVRAGIVFYALQTTTLGDSDQIRYCGLDGANDAQLWVASPDGSIGGRIATDIRRGEVYWSDAASPSRIYRDSFYGGSLTTVVESPIPQGPASFRLSGWSHIEDRLFFQAINFSNPNVGGVYSVKRDGSSLTRLAASSSPDWEAAGSSPIDIVACGIEKVGNNKLM